MYVNKSSGISDCLRICAAMSSTVESLVPAFSARSLPRWITGPSAMGSEKGTPSSIRSAPPRSRAATIPGVAAGDGSPPTMYAMRAGRFSARSLSKSVLILVWIIQFFQIFAINVGVLVAASRKIDDEHLTLCRWRPAQRFGHRVGGFKRGKNSLDARQRTRGIQRLAVGDRAIFGAAL